jgi:phosphatidylglycerol:prolipoprotein diacylglycerol transferase
MMSYVVWDIDPKIVDGIEFLRWYGLCWAVGMVLGYQVLQLIYKTEGIATEELDKLSLYAMLGGIMGARFGHILFYDPSYYLNNPIEILPIRIEPTFQFTGLAGLASHGGTVGALIALYIYCRKYKNDYLWVLDRLIISGALLGCFIRIGNLINSEIIGAPAQLPWAFIFSRIDQTPRHPAQLYEALFYLFISVMLFFIWRSQKVSKHKGFLFGLGLFLIFLQRFLVEFLKENQVEFEEHLALNMGQILSIPLLLLGISVMIGSSKTFPLKIV